MEPQKIETLVKDTFNLITEHQTSPTDYLNETTKEVILPKEIIGGNFVCKDIDDDTSSNDTSSGRLEDIEESSEEENELMHPRRSLRVRRKISNSSSEEENDQSQCERSLMSRRKISMQFSVDGEVISEKQNLSRLKRRSATPRLQSTFDKPTIASERKRKERLEKTINTPVKTVVKEKNTGKCVCEFCGKSFGKKESLRIHKRTHTEALPVHARAEKLEARLHFLQQRIMLLTKIKQLDSSM